MVRQPPPRQLPSVSRAAVRALALQSTYQIRRAWVLLIRYGINHFVASSLRITPLICSFYHGFGIHSAVKIRRRVHCERP
jgi:hypothetical protein